MADVLSRHKDIMYSSRTRQNTDNFQRIHALKMKLLDALKRVPPELLKEGERDLIADYSDAGVVNIVHLIYQHKGYEGHAKDYEFSGTSMREHWEMGLEDTERTLRHRQWLTLPTNAESVTIHDLHREDPT
ncbi:MAG: patatin-like phospholipase family protein, partial [Mesorhizobium sp.]